MDIDVQVLDEINANAQDRIQSTTNALLLIDLQYDFCNQNGTLYVPGAEEDCIRISNMITNNIRSIDQIYVTLDSHHRLHIGHAGFWNSKEDGSGEEPIPFTRLTSDIVNKHWYSKDPTLREYTKWYAQQLESLPIKRVLTIWPDHCLIGSRGHCVEDKTNESLNLWVKHKYSRNLEFVHKGMNNLTEMYSAIKADIPNDDPQTKANEIILEKLRSVNQLIICGEAASHCVNFTVRDIVHDWQSHNLDLSRIFILKDGTSPVIDCHETAHHFFEDMAALGLQIVTCSEMERLLRLSYTLQNNS